MRLFRTGQANADEFRLYYAGDVHGSDLCWRKFLGARSFYRADALIMGGDLTGKAIVPIERRPDGRFESRFLGENRTGASPEDLEKLVEAVRHNGMYPWVASPEEVEQARRDPAAQAALFESLLREELGRWLAMAERIPKGPQAADTLYVMGGNDDPWFIDGLLQAAPGVVACDDKVMRIGNHELLSLSYANRTPWNSPRELDEDDLYRRLRSLADQLESPATSIFNLHVPPFETDLDVAPTLTPDFAPVYQGGHPVTGPVGSKAVRQIIEEVQPLLGLHGHIHESRGVNHVGRTLVVNPGSEYNSGQLHGVLIRIGNGGVCRHTFVVG